MGFWTGMANATKDRADRNERQDARDQDQAQRDKMFDYAKAQDDLATKRLTEQDSIRAEELAYNRANAATAADRADILFQQGQNDRSVAQSQLLSDLYGPSVSSDTGRAGTSGSSTGVTSVEAMRTSGILLRDRLETELPQMTDDQKAFYEPFLNDPKGAHGLMTWVKSQVDDNKDLGMADIPDLIHMVGLVEGKGQQAYTDMTEKLKNGFGVNNPEEMIEALNVARAYTADTLVWGVKREAPTQLGQADVYKQFTTEVGMAASSFMSVNKDQPTDKSIKVGRLYGVLKNGSSTEAMVNDAMFKLYDLGIGQQEALALQGQSNIIDKYFLGRDSTPVTPVGDNPTPTVAISNEEVLATILSNPTISDDEKRNAQSEFDALNGVSSGVSSGVTSGVTSPPAMGEPTRGGPGFDVGTPLRSDLGGLLPEQLTAIDSAILDNPELEGVATALKSGEATREALGSFLSKVPSRTDDTIGVVASGGVALAAGALKGLGDVLGFISGLSNDERMSLDAAKLDATGERVLAFANRVYNEGAYKFMKDKDPSSEPVIDYNPEELRKLIQSMPVPDGMGQAFPNDNTGIQDKSLTDSQALYDIRESDLPQNVIDEAIIAFERDYGDGSADAAYEMIASRQ